jgi:MFS family permease
MVPLWVLRRRPLLTGNLASIALGAALLGLTSYIPTWAQGVHHLDPLVSGLTVASITLGWPIAATIASRMYMRIGFRTTALLGGVLTLFGSVMFISIHATTSVFLVALCGFVTGLGFGFISTPVLVGTQSLVGWARRGVVTASILFSRTIGSAVGIAVFGAIANSSLSHWLTTAPQAISRKLPKSLNVASQVLGGGKIRLAPDVAAYVRLGLYHATHDVFFGILLVGVLGILAISAIPRHMTPLVFDGEESRDDEITLGAQAPPARASTSL